jgi:hypothetical protein
MCGARPCSRQGQEMKRVMLGYDVVRSYHVPGSELMGGG